MPNVTVQKTERPAGLPVFEELNRRFEDIRKRAFDLFEGRGAQLGRDLDDWFRAEREVLNAPAAELAEKNGAYAIQVALPGFEAKDIEVTATPTEIAVRAENRHETKREEEGPDKAKIHWTEFGRKEIFRRIALPDAADLEKVEAKLENGILNITAPKAPGKAETPPGRKIAVAA